MSEQWPSVPSYHPEPYPWQPQPPEPWSVGPPPGTRYDLLARTTLHRWWRPILGTLVIVAGFLAVSVAVGILAWIVSIATGTPLSLQGTSIFKDPVLDLGVQLAILGLAIPLVAGAAWAVQRRRPGTLSSVAGGLRWRWMAWCFPVAFAAVIAGEVAQDVTMLVTGLDPGYDWAGWGRFLPPMVLIVVLVPFQAAAEEYVFRGWVLQSFGAYLRNPMPGIIFGSAAFAALHGYTDWGIAYVFGFGVLMSVLAIRTGGLEAPIALHTTNNLFAFGLSAAGGDLDRALAQGSLPWQSIVGTVVQFAVYAIAILIMARRLSIQTLSR